MKRSIHTLDVISRIIRLNGQIAMFPLRQSTNAPAVIYGKYSTAIIAYVTCWAIGRTPSGHDGGRKSLVRFTGAKVIYIN